MSQSTGLVQPSWNTDHAITMKVCRSHLQFLLVLIPIGLVGGTLGWPAVVVFSLNLLGILQLTAWISLSISSLSSTVGSLANDLLHTIFGNALELTIGSVGICTGQVRIAQSVLLGSILCYLLPVLGSCFFICSYDKMRIEFDRTRTNILCSLMLVISISLILPTMNTTFPSTEIKTNNGINAFLIHSTALVLLLLLFAFFLFRHHTHASIFDPPSDNRQERAPGDSLSRSFGLWRAILTLLLATTVLAICAFFMVGSVSQTAAIMGVREPFVGLIIIPILGNFNKYTTIVATSRSTGIDVGVRGVLSTVIRMMLLVAPLLVLLGWIVEEPAALQLDAFEATVFFISILVMVNMIQDGKSNYFEGLMLIGMYTIAAFSFYIRPEPPKNIIFLGQ